MAPLHAKSALSARKASLSVTGARMTPKRRSILPKFSWLSTLNLAVVLQHLGGIECTFRARLVGMEHDHGHADIRGWRVDRRRERIGVVCSVGRVAVDVDLSIAGYADEL